MGGMLVEQDIGVQDGNDPGQAQRRRNIPVQGNNAVNNINNFVPLDRQEEPKRSFSLGKATENFFKGIISPLTVIINNPIPALGMIGFCALLVWLCPALIPLMLVGGGAFSLFELGKGAVNLTVSAINGDAKGAEDSFCDIGTGVIGTVLTLCGVRSTAMISAEVRTVSSAMRAGANNCDAVASGLKAAEKVKSMSFLEACKENLAMFSKDGLKSVKDSLKLRAMKQEYKLMNMTDTDIAVCIEKNDYKSLEGWISKKLPPETQSEIASLYKEAVSHKNKEIFSKVSKIYDAEISKIAKELGISAEKLKKALPTLEGTNNSQIVGGIYPLAPGKFEAGYLLNPKGVKFKILQDKIITLFGGKPMFNHCGSIDDFIISMAVHEPRHLKQFIEPLVHLSRSEFVSCYSSAFVDKARLALNQPLTGPQKILLNILGKINGNLTYLSHTGRRLRALQIPTSLENKLHARQLLESFIESSMGLQRAHRMGDTAPYLNAFVEVDARMASMLGRLTQLECEILAANGNRQGLITRLLSLGKEFHNESTGFLNPQHLELSKQLWEIQMRFSLLWRILFR